MALLILLEKCKDFINKSTWKEVLLALCSFACSIDWLSNRKFTFQNGWLVLEYNIRTSNDIIIERKNCDIRRLNQHISFWKPTNISDIKYNFLRFVSTYNRSNTGNSFVIGFVFALVQCNTSQQASSFSWSLLYNILFYSEVSCIYSIIIYSVLAGFFFLCYDDSAYPKHRNMLLSQLAEKLSASWEDQNACVTGIKAFVASCRMCMDLFSISYTLIYRKAESKRSEEND